MKIDGASSSAWKCGATIGAATLVVASCETSRDYLDPALRRRVDELKSAVGVEPTTHANGVECGEVLWSWGNEFALAGGMLPVNFPPRFREVALVRFDGR
ncbi:MAG: hypothetical protein VYE73_01345 [Acidobacteriota bacterium]|nr:hypothetical protein [Acidobacteriota bacterium]